MATFWCSVSVYTITGIQDKIKTDREALQPYIEFIEELKQRIQEREKENSKVTAP